MSHPLPWKEIRTVLRWLPDYSLQRLTRRPNGIRPVHLMIGIADHFEPPVPPAETGAPVRLKDWCREYPAAMSSWRDADGQLFRHTYFYPAEQYDEATIDLLADHCQAGWGEIEVHLHHGVSHADTAENTASTLIKLRDSLVDRGCLSRENGVGPARYAFVHGNWALANSDNGRFCGVDEEMQILADTGCYADFTLPAPSSAQTSKINSLYECASPLNQRAPHRRGQDLQCGRPPKTFPLIIQGPLLIDFGRRKKNSFLPGIENGELSGINPPTMRRLGLWQEAAITVLGRPDWLFIKLHCHGMAPGEELALFGAPMKSFLKELVEGSQNGIAYKLHFVTMREMVNIILAACDRREGSPGEYRDYRFQLIHPPART